MSDTTKIVCNNVWKIFGPNPERILKELKPSMSRAEVLAQTGHVIGVKDMSFKVQVGETFVVMGLSGSGKSTLVRCLHRLIEPTAGEIIIDGEDVVKMNHKQLQQLRRNKLAMVFQHFGLFPHRKVVDNIAYGLEIRGMAKQPRQTKAMQTLQMVGLDGWEQHYPRELSGGMQQRVGLARAMAVDPEILIFDEPFSALDPLIRREMQDELLRLQKRVKKTMVFITHDFLEAIKMGDHIAIMKDGETSQIGTPEDIVAHPADNYVRDFTEDVPRYKVLSVGKIMAHSVNRISSDSSAEVARNMLRQNDASFLHVIDAEGKFLGYVQANDLQGNDESLLHLISDSTVVRDDTRLDDLILVVADRSLPLAVVDAGNNLIGEISQSMILKSMTG